MTDDELVKKVAVALATADGLDFNEVCGVDANPDEGYCESGTCVAACWEEHDAEQARRWWRHLARAVIPLVQADTEAQIVAIIQKRIDDRFAEHGTREWDTNACYYEGAAGETYEALDEEADEIIALIQKRGDYKQESQP